MQRGYRHVSKSGFVLVELLPAAILMAVIATVCLKAMALDMHLRQRMDLETRLRESLVLAMESWRAGGGAVIVFDLTDGKDWKVMDFPDESWIPPEAAGGRWIAWKQTQQDDIVAGVAGFAYRINGVSRWQPWIFVRNWNFPSHEPIG